MCIEYREKGVPLLTGGYSYCWLVDACLLNGGIVIVVVGGGDLT